MIWELTIYSQVYEFLHTVNIVHKNNSFLGLKEL